MKKITKKDKEKIKIWELCRPGIDEWVKMMIKEGELKIGNNKYGWTGEDEIVSSIIGFIVLHSEKTMKETMKRIKEKRCPQCGTKLKLIKGETNVYKFACKCIDKNKGVSIG